jgi:hypothetical protein
MPGLYKGLSMPIYTIQVLYVSLEGLEPSLPILEIVMLTITLQRRMPKSIVFLRHHI